MAGNAVARLSASESVQHHAGVVQAASGGHYYGRCLNCLPHTEMNKLFITLGLLFAGFMANAQQLVTSAAITYGTPALVLSGGGHEVTSIRFINGVATNTTLKFYDAATAITNLVRPAYTSYSSYATNFSTTFTNSAGVVVTNTWVGVYRGSTANSAVTNERTKILGPLAAPASATYQADGFVIAPALGLVVLSDLASGTIEVTYRDTNP